MSRKNRLGRRLRVMLDTNVWSMLGRTDQGETFYKAAAELGWEVVLVPSVLLELARSSNVDASQREAQAMLSGNRVQLPTEAELSCTDLLAEMQSLHPEWLLVPPNATRWRELHRFWTVDLWRYARRDWPSLVAAAGTIAEDDAQSVYRSQMAAKTSLLANRATASQPLYIQRPGGGAKWLLEQWPDAPGLEVWRYEGWAAFSDVIEEIRRPRRSDGATRSKADWLEGYVNAHRVADDPQGWATFWFYEVEAARMPHHWLGFTAQRYQVDAKIVTSSPFDAQHASYLGQCDLFLTADRRYVRTLEDMAKDAPFRFARPVRLSGRDGSVVEEIQAALKENPGRAT